MIRPTLDTRIVLLSSQHVNKAIKYCTFDQKIVDSGHPRFVACRSALFASHKCNVTCLLTQVCYCYKSSAVAEMGDRLATIDIA